MRLSSRSGTGAASGSAASGPTWSTTPTPRRCRGRSRLATPLIRAAYAGCMADPEHGVLRTIRAGVLNSGVFLLAAGGHYLAGGDVPEPVVLALLAAFTQLACTLLVRRLSFFAVLAAMILGQ